MNNDLQFQHALEQTMVLALEDWAMMVVEPTDKATQIFELDEPIFLSTITFQGVIDGHVKIVAQDGFLQTLVANILGTESDVAAKEAQIQDAFKELANVVTGNFLTAAYGDDTVFDVVLPSVDTINPQQFRQLFDEKVVYCFIADDNPVIVTFSVHR